MKTALIIYCSLAAIAASGLLVAVLLRNLHLGRRNRRDTELARQYLRIVVQTLMSDDGELPFFPRLYCFGGRLVLAETIARLSASTYGLDQEPLRQIVEHAELESYLLRRARRTGGYRRAWFLALLARMPLGESAPKAVVRFESDSNRSVRFYALMVRLASDPSASLQLMASHADSFSAFELAEIMTLLRRGVLPVAYKPLVESTERNLRSLGLCIVRQFGVEEAERALRKIAANDESPELGCEAVYTLCALRRPLRCREVVRRLEMMNRTERKALLRYMAFEGYAEGDLQGLFSKEEKPYFDALVNSYKRALVCS